MGGAMEGGGRLSWRRDMTAAAGRDGVQMKCSRGLSSARLSVQCPEITEIG